MENTNPQVSQEKIDESVPKQKEYYPASDVCIDLKTVVPISMAYEQRDFNKKLKIIIEQNHSMSVAEFVMDRLHYADMDMLCKAFAKEQIDAIAIAIWNFENTGNGIILADQTGVGKGRVGAGLIRYTILHLKKVPIFMTEKKHLIIDMYRDLIDIKFDAGIPIKVKNQKVVADVEYTDEQILKLIRKEIDANGEITSIDFDFEEEDEDFAVTTAWLDKEENEEKVVELIELYRQQLMEDGEVTYDTVAEGDYKKQMREAVAEGKMLVKPFLPMPFTITNKAGDIIYNMTDGEVKSAVGAKSLPKEYKAIFLPYSQISRIYDKRGNMTDKVKFLQKCANDTVIICDESHTASGSRTATGGQSNISKMMKTFLTNCKYAVYISATYAKRPNNMPLYSLKTSIKECNLSYNTLVEAFQKGGIPLQEAVSAELTKVGQLLRREKIVEGVTDYQYESEETEAGLNQINKLNIVASLFMKVGDFSKLVKDEFGALKKQMFTAEEAKLYKWAGSANRLSFLLFNYFVLGLKVRKTFEQSVSEMKEGRKVVVCIANTLESAFDNMKKDFINNVPYELGDSVTNDFSSYCLYLLNYAFKYTQEIVTAVDDKGEPIMAKVSKKLNDNKSEFEREMMNRIGVAFQKYFAEISTTRVGVPISPIDNIRHQIEEAGFRVGEITGRKRMLTFDSDDLSTGILTKRKIKKTTELVKEFNENKIDCLIINQSGAVGISMHSIPTTDSNGKIVPPVNVIKPTPPDSLRPNNELKARTMIITQMELDVNKEVQKLGRISRTGQIYDPKYVYLVSAIPSERRLTAMFEKKLRSLSANVTGNQEQFNDLFSADDFFGVLAVEPFNETMDLMNQPLRITRPIQIYDYTKILYFYPYNFQKQFYDTFGKKLNEKIDDLKSKGLYNTMGSVKDYSAVIKETKPFIIGDNNAYSNFGGHTYLDIADCMVYEDKNLESFITTKMMGGHFIHDGSETLIFQGEKYVAYLNERNKSNLEFQKDICDNSIANANKTIAAFREDLANLNEDAKKFEDLPRAIELQTSIRENEAKLSGVNNEIVSLIGQGKMEDVNILAKQVQTIQATLSELKKKYEENSHYEYVLTNQTEHDKILRKIIKTNENIAYNEELIVDYLNDYKSKENIITIAMQYVAGIGNIFEYERLSDAKMEWDNDSEKYLYKSHIEVPKQKVVLYDVSFDTKSAFENVTLGRVNLKFVSVTDTSSQNLITIHTAYDAEQTAEGLKNPVTVKDTGINYKGNWNDYVSTINTGTLQEKLIINGNLLRAFSILTIGEDASFGSVMKYSLENKKIVTGIELGSETEKKYKKLLNNNVHDVYFDLSELNYNKLVRDLIFKNKAKYGCANQLLHERQDMFLVTNVPSDMNYDEFRDSDDPKFLSELKVLIYMNSKPQALDVMAKMLKDKGKEGHYSYDNYTGKPHKSAILGEELGISYSSLPIYLSRDRYRLREDIFIHNTMLEQEFSNWNRIDKGKGFILSMDYYTFMALLAELKNEGTGLMSITSSKVVEDSNFYMFADNSSNILNLGVDNDGDSQVKDIMDAETEKSIDELIEELLQIVKEPANENV